MADILAFDVYWILEHLDLKPGSGFIRAVPTIAIGCRQTLFKYRRAIPALFEPHLQHASIRSESRTDRIWAYGPDMAARSAYSS